MKNRIRLPQFAIALATGICIWLPFESAWGLDAQNFIQLQESLGFKSFYQELRSQQIQRKIKVAVFDNGFAGYEKSLGTALPSDTHYIADSGSSAGGAPTQGVTETTHGRFMAEILYAMMTENGARKDLAPEIYLFKVTGFTNLKSAIDESLRLNVDVVLHSMVREYGSNYDGAGFFNTEVNRAMKGGILWVNAAGNFAKTTFNLANIQTDGDDWVQLPGVNQALPIRCLKPKSGADKCSLRLVLSWNDFKDDASFGTDKDLDLVLTDDTLNIVQASSLTQTKEEKAAPGFSKYSREIIEAELKPGRYFVRVKNRSLNFTAKDALRISGDGEFIQFEMWDENENLFNPADNSGVITVGASDSDSSSRSVKLGKPDILAPSLLRISDKEAYLGSSNAAAIVAAGVGLVKMVSPESGRNEILSLIRAREYENVRGSGISDALLKFGPTGTLAENNKITCYQVVSPYASYPAYIQNILAQGAVFVETTMGLRMVTLFDPLQLMHGRNRVRKDDMILATPQGLQLRPRREMRSVPADWAEVFQLPKGAMTCQLPKAWREFVTPDKAGFHFQMPRPSSL